jgi:PD-(D/E)XK nuclease superfamily
MNNESRRPQMHISGIDRLFSCGIAFEKRYILNERKPATSYLHVGKGVDEAANLNLQNKIDTKTLLPVAQVVDVARDAVRHSIESDGLALTPDEIGMTEKAAGDAAVDKAVRLTEAHAKILAPRLKPKRVQAKFSLEIPGFPFDVVGTRDLDDEDDATRDLKTSKKSPPKLAAEQSDQLTLYALSRAIIEKVALPVKVALDYVVDLKRETKVAPPLESTRDRDDFQVILNRFEAAARVLESGAFTPARQTDWWCNLRWCEYAPTCKYFRSPKSMVLEEGE